VLIAAQDADDDVKFLKNSIERVELGALKGNEADQNYDQDVPFAARNSFIAAAMSTTWVSTAKCSVSRN
jgi:hypothetical protein